MKERENLTWLDLKVGRPPGEWVFSSFFQEDDGRMREDKWVILPQVLLLASFDGSFSYLSLQYIAHYLSRDSWISTKDSSKDDDALLQFRFTWLDSLCDCAANKSHQLKYPPPTCYCEFEFQISFYIPNHEASLWAITFANSLRWWHQHEMKVNCKWTVLSFMLTQELNKPS